MLLHIAEFSPFLRLSSIPLHSFNYVSSLCHSFVGGHLVCSHILAIANSAVMNMSSRFPDLNSFG